ncbi:cation transporter [Anabaena cylindrica FACHB-243]|uniref:Cation diffusion facilitator family transporter n=1 Tax=Anabaena cylindrica (strain ATCC 27899 / PCC 7122) TaxID=272123 RepID=K9ZGA2_ANACC|nr:MULTISPECIES: cation transporter [Anabaena]AFZ57774.1 cation diffusion facilitator family transporter [Anabaena cylindrica PCC 7122]MBD2419316.1 cation transporter [Anabaena cylindrica FACHB-243]MBY5281384.1 cation transporter [Anabaena sp. CCAP 1446/1C]MBY5308418.1 cation transporter [Anabaena sp. CCAP 1446/1C]MCM2408082.1 cation transporter [Anabaena sp. CCAP 1446/1C]
MNNSRLERLEQTSIYLSIGGTLFLSILGISFGLAIESAAVMLDGFFNIISLIMALATLWISRILKRPEGRKFQFGYKGFAPLLNLCKGLMIMGLSMFAFISAIAALLHGGRKVEASVAVIYTAIAAFTCLSIALVHNSIANKTGSPLVRVDAKNWIINGGISLSVGIVFTVITLIKNTPFNWFVDYADPTIVVVLVLLASPIPVKVVLESLNQLLLGAPAADLQKRINGIIDVATNQFPCAKHYLRITEVGEALYLHLYWLLPSQQALTSLEAVDEMRGKITDIVKQEFPNVTLDIIFTQDEEWFTTMNPV